MTSAGIASSALSTRRSTASRLRRRPLRWSLFEVSGGNEQRVMASLRTFCLLADRGHRFGIRGRDRMCRPLNLDRLQAMRRRSSWQASSFSVGAERAG
jgi:hypothetical protein